MRAIFAAAAVLATAQPASGGSVDACAAKLSGYAAADPAESVWSLDLAAPSGGRLVYIGAEHLRDPAHPQFARIAAAFEEARPTAVFVEGRNRGVGTDAQDTIRTRGESGYVRFLAAQAGAEVRSLEPSPVDQARALLARFPPDRVYLFFVLREATLMRDREGLRGEALDTATSKLLDRMAPLAAAAGLQSPPFSDLAGLQQAYARYWPGAWREAQVAWFDPEARSADTGGVFTNEINRADSEFRDAHMFRVLAEAALAGEQVFAAVGRNHVPRQAAALRCALSP